jgi:hypothetical protein
MVNYIATLEEGFRGFAGILDETALDDLRIAGGTLCVLSELRVLPTLIDAVASFDGLPTAEVGSLRLGPRALVLVRWTNLPDTFLAISAESNVEALWSVGGDTSCVGAGPLMSALARSS